ncbi:MAG: hypothetical protein IKX03_06670, partial [Bacteroidales bacterium]|nr:hypothetical protein [Bacteroidales bacterium]
AVLPALLLVTSCGEKHRREVTSVLVYLAGNNSLESYGPDCLSQLKSGFIPEDKADADILLVYYHVPGEAPTLKKISKTTSGLIKELVLCSYPSFQNSATPATLAKVIADAEAICPADHHSLVMWSHSTGFLPNGYYDKLWYGDADLFSSAKPRSGERRTFGRDYGSDEEIEITDLANVLPFKYEVILFDSCLMGGVEVAYELKDKCEYLVVSPTEIMAKGFPYYIMMEELLNNKDKAAAATVIDKEYYDYYNAQHGGGTVTVVNTSGLGSLAQITSRIISNHRSEISALNRNTLQYYDRCRAHWTYDLDDIISRVATASEYSTFQSALSASTVYKAATPTFLSIPINKYSGYGVYLPYPEYKNLNAFYKTLAWNKATGLVE